MLDKEISHERNRKDDGRNVSLRIKLSVSNHFSERTVRNRII